MKTMETNIWEQVHQQHAAFCGKWWAHLRRPTWRMGPRWRDSRDLEGRKIPESASIKSWKCVSRRACVLIQGLLAGQRAPPRRLEWKLPRSRVTTASHARCQHLGSPRPLHQSTPRARAAGFNAGSASTQRLQNTSEPPTQNGSSLLSTAVAYFYLVILLYCLSDIIK